MSKRIGVLNDRDVGRLTGAPVVPKFSLVYLGLLQNCISVWKMDNTNYSFGCQFDFNWILCWYWEQSSHCNRQWQGNNPGRFILDPQVNSFAHYFWSGLIIASESNTCESSLFSRAGKCIHWFYADWKSPTITRSFLSYICRISTPYISTILPPNPLSFDSISRPLIHPSKGFRNYSQYQRSLLKLSRPFSIVSRKSSIWNDRDRKDLTRHHPFASNWSNAENWRWRQNHQDRSTKYYKLGETGSREDLVLHIVSMDHFWLWTWKCFLERQNLLGGYVQKLHFLLYHPNGCLQ